MKKNNGITLIALVVTIVVLIILASVAITLSLGDNGIFKKAAKAKEDTLVAQNEESMQIAESTNSIDGIVGLSTRENHKWTLKTGITLPYTVEEDGFIQYTASPSVSSRSSYYYITGSSTGTICGNSTLGLSYTITAFCKKGDILKLFESDNVKSATISYIY